MGVDILGIVILVFFSPLFPHSFSLFILHVHPIFSFVVSVTYALRYY